MLLAEIERLVTAGGARSVVVTDVCFTGAGRDGETLLPDRRLAVPTSTTPPARGATWLATQANEAAGPLPEARHGAFTWAVLGALRGWADGALDGRRDGTVTSSEAQAWVRTALRKLGIEEQTPSWTGEELVLVAAKGRLEPAPELARVVESPAIVAPVPTPAPRARPADAGRWSASQGVQVVRVPAGRFVMGSPPDEAGRHPNEGPVDVELGRDLLVMRTEVTQALYKAVVRKNPARFKRCGKHCPVESVSWVEAARFANALSEKDGFTPAYTIVGDLVTWDREADGWRLPTEAEWEHAARAGGAAVYAGGDDPVTVAWFRQNAKEATHPVCTLRPNAWDLCDLSGNVSEWTWDVMAPQLPGGRDPAGPERGAQRTVRSGSWMHAAMFVRVAQRQGMDPKVRSDAVGFRLVRWAE